MVDHETKFNEALIAKGYVRYIFISLFFKSKRERL